jgi:hypothetical protein
MFLNLSFILVLQRGSRCQHVGARNSDQSSPWTFCYNACTEWMRQDVNLWTRCTVCSRPVRNPAIWSLLLMITSRLLGSRRCACEITQPQLWEKIPLLYFSHLSMGVFLWPQSLWNLYTVLYEIAPRLNNAILLARIPNKARILEWFRLLKCPHIPRPVSRNILTPSEFP